MTTLSRLQSLQAGSSDLSKAMVPQVTQPSVTLLRRPAQRQLGSRQPVACRAKQSVERPAVDANFLINRRALGLLSLGAALFVAPRWSHADEELSALEVVPEAQPFSAAESAAEPLAASEALPSAAEASLAQPAAPAAQPASAPTSGVRVLTLEERILLEQNQKIRSLNRAPDDFPAFIRKGYDVQVLADGYTYSSDGLIYKDYEVGTGPSPTDGQQVLFDYAAYNESGATVGSTYRGGRPTETRLGINGMIPGFEMGIKTMKVGGKRRLIVPPELGPPVGPSTFFSSRQFEVFDIELLEVKSCARVAVFGGFTTNVVCQ